MLLVVPCHNEESTIAEVVTSSRAIVPTMEILVADNASTDRTADVAAAAGATVVSVPYPGKGRAVRALLERSNHDVTVMVDGDATYDPAVLTELVHLVFCRGFDLVNVARVVSEDSGLEYRRGHQLGNQALTSLQRTLTGIPLRDILSGYKALSRRFVASFPVRSQKFQVEVEIAAHAAALDLASTEISGSYRARPEGSSSKLSTYSDGLSILRAILKLYRDLRPFPAFTLLSVPWLVLALIAVAIPLAEYLATGEVARFPLLIGGVAAFTVGMLLLSTGWILDRTQALRRDELAVAAADMMRSRAESSLLPPRGLGA